jgi:hypothetical protein
VRDRLSYLFLGRVRRFRLLFEPNEGNFQLVQHQELKRLFDVNGIRLTHVVYTAHYTEDLLYLPLALVLWPWQCSNCAACAAAPTGNCGGSYSASNRCYTGIIFCG